MSYDIELVIDTGGSLPHVIQEFAITSNVGEMLRLALRETWVGNEYTSSQFTSFMDLQDWKASGAAIPLALALEFLEDERNNEALSRVEPANRWGTLKELTEFLSDFLDALKKHPKSTIVVF